MYYIPISPTNSSFSAALAALAALAAALVATLAATITAGSPSPLFLTRCPELLRDTVSTRSFAGLRFVGKG